MHYDKYFLRERFGIEKNRSMVSKIINEALKAEKIRIYDESVGTKARSMCHGGHKGKEFASPLLH